ncbi:4Fe-4S dicluster domain-containing protein [Desulfonatronovibrio hydrogenovorans]|uniref:4Fe-4S dicluster domain-containing protein n=1 Tax=Desulfonatronovibrio hydrogenovorans TaxID=53245 RepID=UPI000490AC44|nr:4Fe-4S dicluster domain-containing protein [Desulfonatronovibrio hydrogenovorans]
MEALKLGERKEGKLDLTPEMADVCYTCTTCSSGCPISGVVPGWDARKAIRSIAMGLEQEVVDSKFPWVCTLCGRCQYACPQGVQLQKTFRGLRSLRERDKVPGPLHKGTIMNYERGNNLGIPKFDFLFLLAELGVELMEEDEEQPCPGFYVPVDKENANIIVTINSKEPFGEPEDMAFWWKIFYAAKEDWTVSSVNWEGVNWGLFTGDDENMKIQVERVLENARRLKAKTILYPE